MDALRQYSLLSPEQIAELPHLSQGRCGDARTFAKALMQRGWLSVYQVNQLLAGNGHELTIGPYFVLDKLGQGGLSSVFKGRHRAHGNLVAIKIIKPEVFASPEGRYQFLQEVEAMARLDHPNIVQFCDADQFKDTFYFAMEYVDGTDMGKVIRLSGALPVHEACDYVRQAALGLQHAYERNLIHRDIKPVNLFLTHVAQHAGLATTAFATHRDPAPSSRDGKPTMKVKPLIKILDWGLASLRNPKGLNADETAATSVVGTADYLSPEQARNANTVDIRGDIYSLGCTLYFLLTGQPPFANGTLMQKILQHQQNEPMPVDVFRMDVPEGVIAVLKRMMMKQPEDRYQTPASVALALLPFTRSSHPDANRSGSYPSPKAGLPGPSADTPLPQALAREEEVLRLRSAPGKED
ncbi:MAG TPA: serine/threonine-protein kinase [Gemmataceae bacterium]|nr:serine/threonine-protein kinase [Gemmataceae bacterium]